MIKSLITSLQHDGCRSYRTSLARATVRWRRVLGLSSILAFGFLPEAGAQDVAVKTNGLYWATTTPNLGLEVAFDPKWTVDLSGGYNPWTFSDDKKMRCWLVQPELRYWICEKFEGHFVGVHLHGAQFFGGFSDKRYDGYLAGGGVTYGYDWILSPHWNVEAALGVGYAHLWYKQSPRIPCLKCWTNKTREYVGVTKLSVSIVYLF